MRATEELEGRCFLNGPFHELEFRAEAATPLELCHVAKDGLVVRGLDVPFLQAARAASETTPCQPIINEMGVSISYCRSWIRDGFCTTQHLHEGAKGAKHI